MTSNESVSADDAVMPYLISVSATDLVDLTERLARTRWPDPGPVTDGSQGPTLAAVRRLVERWRDGYDWRAAEALLNGWGSSRTVLDGVGVHFLHIRSPEPDAVPLLLAHGWPGSVLEFRDIIGPLSNPAAHGGDARQAFHLVIPSMPGFGFSDRPTTPGWNVGRVAHAWAGLMKRLGYDQHWFAQGGDWGSAVVTALAHMQAPGLAGIHLNMVVFQPTQEEIADASPEELDMLGGIKRFWEEQSGYMTLQNTRPQSVGFALTDSPVGLAAWIYALFQEMTDSDGQPERVIPLDHIIDDIMLYWLPSAGASSARFYWENKHAADGLPTGPVPLPAGVTMFPREAVRLSRRWAQRQFSDLRHYDQPDRGGHFGAMEHPEALIAAIRATFSSLR